MIPLSFLTNTAKIGVLFEDYYTKTTRGKQHIFLFHLKNDGFRQIMNDLVSMQKCENKVK